MSGMSLNLDQGALAGLLRSPEGLVGRHIRRIADETAGIARKTAPRKSGRLRSNIIVERGALGAMSVTANVEYALAVHEGTKAKTIKTNKPMAFPGKGRGPRLVVVKEIDRPSTKAQPFLVDAMKAAFNSYA